MIVLTASIGADIFVIVKTYHFRKRGKEGQREFSLVSTGHMRGVDSVLIHSTQSLKGHVRVPRFVITGPIVLLVGPHRHALLA